MSDKGCEGSFRHTVHPNSEDTCDKCGCGPKERLKWCPEKVLSASAKTSIRQGRIKEIRVSWATVVRADYR